MTSATVAAVRGVIVPTVTLRDAAERPDPAATARHVGRLLNNGADGVLLFGTTGEGLRLALAERLRVLAALIGCRGLFVGAPGNDPDESIATANAAAAIGAVALVIHPPPGLPAAEHAGRLLAVASASPLPVVIYNRSAAISPKERWRDYASIRG